MGLNDADSVGDTLALDDSDDDSLALPHADATPLDVTQPLELADTLVEPLSDALTLDDDDGERAPECDVSADTDAPSDALTLEDVLSDGHDVADCDTELELLSDAR